MNDFLRRKEQGLSGQEPSAPAAVSSPEKAEVAAIVPAYNEECRIRAVLEAILDSGAVDEIIVVSDASTDRTYEVSASVPGVRPVQLERNLGKGGAMGVGIRQTEAEYVVFLDADLIGLRPEHVRHIVEPVVSGSADLSVGVFRGGRFLTDLSQILVSCVSGQRAMRRQFFLEVPKANTSRFGVEVAITYYARKRKLCIVSVPIRGVTHPMKEEKLGPIRGFAARMKMYSEIARYLLITTWKERNGNASYATAPVTEPARPEPEPSDLSG
ncbi:MAG: glycosyltransferase family 2 protein [Armatimonadetes bacterium]|nr:glycosyltransferase family 2 protein [Armatimonadota bacterium]